MNAALSASLFELAVRLAPSGAQFLVQSTLLIAAGLIIGRLCRRQGPALQSVILRTTLVAVIICPLASLLYGRLGVRGRILELPTAVVPVRPRAAPSNVNLPATIAPAEAAPASATTV